MPKVCQLSMLLLPMKSGVGLGLDSATLGLGLGLGLGPRRGTPNDFVYAGTLI